MDPKKPQLQLLLALMIFFAPSRAFENYLAGSRMAALSQVGAAIPDVWSVSHNQAGLVFISQTSIAFNHQQKFLLKQLGLSNLAIALPLERSSWGLHASYFGYSQYHENKIGLAYALKLSPRIGVGFQLDYFRSAIPTANYILQQISFEAGIMALPLENLTIGAHVFNPIPKKWLEKKEIELPLIARLGTSYSFDQILLIHSELQFHSKNNRELRFGLEYHAVKSLTLRAGTSTGVYQFSFGIGYSLKKIRFDLAYSKHYVLGSSPSIDFIYVW